MATLTFEQKEKRVGELWRQVERDERILAKTRARLVANLAQVKKLRQDTANAHRN